MLHILALSSLAHLRTANEGFNEFCDFAENITGSLTHLPEYVLEMLARIKILNFHIYLIGETINMWERGFDPPSPRIH